MSATESPAELIERLRREREVRPARPAAPRVPIWVTGSRSLTPTEPYRLAFWRLFDRLGGTELHHGAAPGVDRAMAADALRRRPGLPVIPHPANWSLHGKAAGPIRNEEGAILCACCIAFPGNDGTADSVRKFHRLGKKVWFVEDELQEARLEAERDSIERDHIDIGLWTDP